LALDGAAGTAGIIGGGDIPVANLQQATTNRHRATNPHPAVTTAEKPVARAVAVLERWPRVVPAAVPKPVAAAVAVAVAAPKLVVVVAPKLLVVAAEKATSSIDLREFPIGLSRSSANHRHGWH
jgi:hypothetical protein